MLVQTSASPDVRFGNTVLKRTPRPSRAALVLMAVALSATPHAASAFTQSGVATFIGDGIPMGHEWITRLAAFEVLRLPGEPPIDPIGGKISDPTDPRNQWGAQGKAKNTDISSVKPYVAALKRDTHPDYRYRAKYMAVYSAIVGERWVDIGGFNVGHVEIAGKLEKITKLAEKTSYERSCWGAVAQEAVEVQYDHFMRRYDESGGEGGVQAARRSREQFIQYFVNAAVAPSARMIVWDGGGTSAKTEVDRNYFLFGRAVHLFEDSFSPEHTVRLPQDNYEQVRQVKSYLCAAGSEQHTHSQEVRDFSSSGDIIWNHGTEKGSGSWNTYTPSNMKHIALVATEATKDLWAAFIRTMAAAPQQREAVAKAEAQTLARNWLNTNDNEVRDWYKNDKHRDKTYVLGLGEVGPGQNMPTCVSGLGLKTGNDQQARANELKNIQRSCLFNIRPKGGYGDLFDPSLRVPYNWEWLNKARLDSPPANFQVSDQLGPPPHPGIGVRMRIKCPNGKYMVADGKGWIYCRDGTPLELVQVGSNADAVYRVRYDPDRFMSYGTGGAVGLYNSPREANFRLVHGAGHTTIESLRWKQYMWLKKESPHIDRKGHPNNREAQWFVELLP